MRVPYLSEAIPFDYQVEASLTSGSTSEVTLNISADADFEVHSIHAYSTENAVGDVEPNDFSVRIKDSGTGLDFSNARIGQAMLAPRATGGRILPKPVRIQRNTNLVFDFKDEAAATHTARVVLRGFKIRNAGI